MIDRCLLRVCAWVGVSVDVALNMRSAGTRVRARAFDFYRNNIMCKRLAASWPPKVYAMIGSCINVISCGY